MEIEEVKRKTIVRLLNKISSCCYFRYQTNAFENYSKCSVHLPFFNWRGMCKSSFKNHHQKWKLFSRQSTNFIKTILSYLKFIVNAHTHRHSERKKNPGGIIFPFSLSIKMLSELDECFRAVISI